MDSTEVARLVKKLSLSSEANQAVVTVSAMAVQESVSRLKRCLVGKIFSPKAPNRETLITQVPRILQIRGTVNIEVVGDNLFLADFSSPIDRTWVMRDGPWHFFNSLMAFKEPHDLQNPSDIVFDEITVWVQLHNLPFLYMHSSILSEIAAQIGTIQEVDMGVDGSCTGKFARVRVTLNIERPLLRCVNTLTEDGEKPTLIILLYERLPDFCYVCGKVGHVLRDCENDTVNKAELEFGPWLRAGRTEDIRTRLPTRGFTEGGRGSQRGRGSQGRGSHVGASFSSMVSDSQNTSKLLVEQDNSKLFVEPCSSNKVVRCPPLKLIAERELEGGPNVTICAVKKKNLLSIANKEEEDGHVVESDDVSMEVLGDVGLTDVQRRGDTLVPSPNIPIRKEKEQAMIDLPKKRHWKKQARVKKGGLNTSVGGHGILMAAVVSVGDKRGLIDEVEDETERESGTGVKRLKEGHGISFDNLAITAEAAQQPRRAQ